MSTDYLPLRSHVGRWAKSEHEVRLEIIAILRGFPEWVNLELIAFELHSEFSGVDIASILTSMLRDGEIGCKAELDTEVFGKYCPYEVCVYGLQEGANRERAA